MKHNIDKKELLIRLEQAVNVGIEYARTMVNQTLPQTAMVLIEPNS